MLFRTADCFEQVSFSSDEQKVRELHFRHWIVVEAREVYCGCNSTTIFAQY
jgi:hypothetical protein